jgi:uncharacterized protein YndB with AHSA1/START domain
MSDRIEKRVFLKAPRERVWRAISDAEQFGAWFGVDFDGPFVAGKHLSGRMAPTKVDPAIAKLQEPYRGAKFDWTVDRIEPIHTMAFSWHPFAIDPAVDYSSEPMTHIIFELAEAPGGTNLTITETGFDRIPLARRAQAFGANSEGWEMQAALIAKYLDAA